MVPFEEGVVGKYLEGTVASRDCAGGKNINAEPPGADEGPGVDFCETESCCCRLNLSCSRAVF